LQDTAYAFWQLVFRTLKSRKGGIDDWVIHRNTRRDHDTLPDCFLQPTLFVLLVQSKPFKSFMFLMPL
jgi:hypothetical protein